MKKGQEAEITKIVFINIKLVFTLQNDAYTEPDALSSMRLSISRDIWALHELFEALAMRMAIHRALSMNGILASVMVACKLNRSSSSSGPSFLPAKKGSNKKQKQSGHHLPHNTYNKR